MEQTKLALSAVMIVAVGLIGTNFVTGLEMTDQEKINAYEDSTPIYGHITIVHSDPDGNILAYVQTDNLVYNDGLDCLAERVFGTSNSACQGTLGDLFDKIGLFNAETFTDPTQVITDFTLLTTPGLGIASATSVLQTAAADQDNNDGVITDLLKTFTVGVDAVTEADLSNIAVNGAGLLNDGGDVLFAAQTFNAVSLNTGDTLTITWSIKLG